ncbi:MAG: hypothetical protein AAF564_22600 [Bacteroidota bacterium]
MRLTLHVLEGESASYDGQQKQDDIYHGWIQFMPVKYWSASEDTVGAEKALYK